jgi:hypothetical protein
MSGFVRSTFLASIAALALAPALAAADDVKRSFRIKARLDSVKDKKTVRQIETVVADGKRGDFLDGSWNYDRIPRMPVGLYAVFTVKDGAKIHLKADFEYGASGREAAGGNNMLVTDAKTTIEEDFTPATPVAYPWTIAGEDYLLVISVEPVVPK